MAKKISKEIIKLAKKYSKSNNRKACKITWKMFYTGLGRHQYFGNGIYFKFNKGYKRLKAKSKKRNGKNRIYSKDFKLQIINRILINHESINSVAIDIGLASNGILHN